MDSTLKFAFQNVRLINVSGRLLQRNTDDFKLTCKHDCNKCEFEEAELIGYNRVHFLRSQDGEII